MVLFWRFLPVLGSRDPIKGIPGRFGALEDPIGLPIEPGQLGVTRTLLFPALLICSIFEKNC